MACVVPCSNVELHSMSREKKWWMVWPPMWWATTPLGASLATTSPRDHINSISAFRRLDFPVPAGPTMAALVCLWFVSDVDIQSKASL